MERTIKDFIPCAAVGYVQQLMDHDELTVCIKKERKTRHGDYRKMPSGLHQITVNSNLNPYRFLLTLIHEIAHYEAYKKYGRQILPHGKEWKYTFKTLMLPLLNPTVFEEELLPLLAKHFVNPRASSDSDVHLARFLKRYDPPNDKTYVYEVPLGAKFKMYNGRVFKKGPRRRTRHEGLEVATGKLYLFNPNAEVELLSSPARVQ